MRRILCLVVTAAALVAAAQAFAQDDATGRYPNRTVKIIVSAPPGGGLDIAARVIADRLTKMWGQPFVVENRPGAAGNLGAEAVAQAEPDGYTLLAAQPGPLTTNVVMYKKLNFDPAAFEPLAIMTSIPNTLTVRLDLPAASVAELIAYAKANPGKLNFGSQGVGTTRIVRARHRHQAHPRALSRDHAGGERSHRRQRRYAVLPAGLGARAIPGEQGQDAGGDDGRTHCVGARGADHVGSRRQRLSLRQLERARGAAEDAGGDRGQAQ